MYFQPKSVSLYNNNFCIQKKNCQLSRASSINRPTLFTIPGRDFTPRVLRRLRLQEFFPGAGFGSNFIFILINRHQNFKRGYVTCNLFNLRKSFTLKLKLKPEPEPDPSQSDAFETQLTPHHSPRPSVKLASTAENNHFPLVFSLFMTGSVQVQVYVLYPVYRYGMLYFSIYFLLATD